VRRFALALVVGLLALSASGLSSLVVAEPCSAYELGGQSGETDRDCPPTCVICGCCAQAVEPGVAVIASSPDAPVPLAVFLLPRYPDTDPRDILHVPRIALA
jgi:hypothetical protein